MKANRGWQSSQPDTSYVSIRQWLQFNERYETFLHLRNSSLFVSIRQWLQFNESILSAIIVADEPQRSRFVNDSSLMKVFILKYLFKIGELLVSIRQWLQFNESLIL